jgi:signal transduction histidine kinase
MRRVLETGEPSPVAETQRQARDGRLIPVIRSSAPLKSPDGSVIGLLDTLTDITALKQLDEEARALAQVRERELIAMDLHDGLIQSLYALVLTLDARERALLESSDPAAGPAQEALKAARMDVERVIEETRSYLFDLKAREFVPRDLQSGLLLLTDGLRLNAGVVVDLKFDPSVEALLQPDVRGHLLYLMREAVSNVVRHARATHVQIEVGCVDDRFVLTVRDDGRGFDTTARAPAGRHGLRNMAERARLVGGQLNMQSQPGAGTRLRLELPIFRSAL